MELYTMELVTNGWVMWEKGDPNGQFHSPHCPCGTHAATGSWGWSPQEGKWFCPVCVEKYASQGVPLYTFEELERWKVSYVLKTLSYVPFFGHLRVPDLYPLRGGKIGALLKRIHGIATVEIYFYHLNDGSLSNVYWIKAWWPNGSKMNFSEGVVLPLQEPEETCCSSQPHGSWARQW